MQEWSAQVESLRGGAVRRYRILRAARPVSYVDLLDLWQGDAAFRSYFIDMLASAPFATYCWETPPVTRASGGRNFEFVLLDSPYLEVPADPTAFVKHFESCGDELVIGFPNLGGDAFLVVPRPVGPASVYRHLAAFLRGGPEGQKHALWQAVAATLRARLAERPVWLSTAGGGVAWLHVRLDTCPKYYGFHAYAAAE